MSDKKAPAVDPIEHACALYERADARRAEGQLTKALADAKKALKLLETHDNPDGPDVANILLTLGGICEDLGDYDAAERHYERAIGNLKGARGGGDIARLRIQAVGSLGGLYRNLGRYKEAETLSKRALSLAEKTFGDVDLEVASCLNNLGVLYKVWGRADEAEALYREAIDIALASLETAHRFVSDCRTNYAELLHQTGRKQDAKALLAGR